MEEFLNGGDTNLSVSLARRVGLIPRIFPVRYLGVPLTSKKLSRSDYQPLIERVKRRFSSWFVRHLSFAGRLQLLQSVIYSTINFWGSIFIIPNSCLADLERMCSGFLWSGDPSTATGAKVRWESVCSPKRSGGLGLRRLKDWNQVLTLKLIWLIFAAGGSLWVSWVRRNLIGVANFWTLNPMRSGSWIWRAICKLRPMARPFLVCEVGDGTTGSFWHDSWTPAGPLIHLTGPEGPRTTGLGEMATIAEAIVHGNWWLHNSRSRNSTIAAVMGALPSAQPIIEASLNDAYLWHTGPRPEEEGNGSSLPFSTARTWQHLFADGVHVNWCSAVWLKGRIPKHAFISWITARDRLPTRDRLCSWGLNVPQGCVLCDGGTESRQHLFFDCPFSNTIWNHFLTRASVTPPPGFDERLTWLLSPSNDGNLVLIMRLVYQATVYTIWQERNARVHSDRTSSMDCLIDGIKLTVRSKLAALKQQHSPIELPLTSTLDPLDVWFLFFQL